MRADYQLSDPSHLVVDGCNVLDDVIDGPGKGRQLVALQLQAFTEGLISSSAPTKSDDCSQSSY